MISVRINKTRESHSHDDAIRKKNIPDQINFQIRPKHENGKFFLQRMEFSKTQFLAFPPTFDILAKCTHNLRDEFSPVSKTLYRQTGLALQSCDFHNHWRADRCGVVPLVENSGSESRQAQCLALALWRKWVRATETSTQLLINQHHLAHQIIYTYPKVLVFQEQS